MTTDITGGDMAAPQRHEKWFRLAAATLHAAQSGQWPRANTYLRRLTDECAENFHRVALAWIDTYASAAGVTEYGQRQITPTWENGDSGERGTADDVPASVRWAGQLASARVNGDPESFDAIYRSAPFDDPAAMGAHVVALLQMCAAGLNRIGQQGSGSVLFRSTKS